MEENSANKEISSGTVGDFEEVPVYQEVETKKKEVRTDSYFDGGILELIGWNILAILITVFSLGLANSWAKCMLYTWQLKHTVYNGKRLKFEGTGGDLFVNRFKWLFFTIITLGIYALFIPVKKAKWVISNIHFEDEEFVKEESFFDGKTIQLIGINILSKIITIFSLGLLYPFAVCLKLRWINKHTVINKKKLVFAGSSLRLWGKYLLWDILTLITFGIFAIWIPILSLKWETKNIHIKKVGEEEKKDMAAFVVVPVVIILMSSVIYLIIGAVIATIPAKDFDEFLNGVSEVFYEKDTYSKVGQQSKEIAVKQNSVTKSKEKETKTVTSETSKPKTTVSEASKPKTKTSITVGGYTLNFGTYVGTMVQGVWDDTTMTSTEKKTKITLKLTENSITLDGKTAGYTISGNNIKWKAMDFDALQVSGNNRITYIAENCPELVWQGY